MKQIVLTILGAFVIVAASNARPRPRPFAELIFFTEDTKEASAPLNPEFKNHSVWSGMGKASNGKVYVAVSNHIHGAGNVAIYAYDPSDETMSLLGDLKQTSSEVDNWMPDESHHKVHTFLLEHADGRLYFASDDYDPTPFLRGAHLYAIDPYNDTIEDLSKTRPVLMTRSLETIPNKGTNAERSGVFIEYYGIKGIGLNKSQPDLLYAMTYPEGHLIKSNMGKGQMSVIGQSPNVNYVFHVSEDGSVYYGSGEEGNHKLLKYDPDSDTTVLLADNLPGGEFGAIAPNSDGSLVYFLIASSKQVYRLDTTSDTFEHFANLCGSNWWRLYNLTLSPDERSLYFVSNNNSKSVIRRLDTKTKQCSEVLNVNNLLGSRDLCFGGINIWDDNGAFYVPVWTHQTKESDLAILKATIEMPAQP